jgi:8-oxo-dGTP diphosphatase
MKFFFGMKALIARADGKVLIVRESSNYGEGTETGKWDVVGGRINLDEPMFAGLKREVAEESGLQIEIGQVLALTENFIEIKGERCHIIRSYYACQVMGEEAVRLSVDHDKFDWIDPETHNDWHLMEDLHEVFDKFIDTQSRP